MNPCPMSFKAPKMLRHQSVVCALSVLLLLSFQVSADSVLMGSSGSNTRVDCVPGTTQTNSYNWARSCVLLRAQTLRRIAVRNPGFPPTTVPVNCAANVSAGFDEYGWLISCPYQTVDTMPAQPATAACASPTALFNNWNTGGCGLTNVARGRLTQNSMVTQLIFWSDSAIDGGQITMKMEGPGISQSITTMRRNCQGSWCEGIVNLQQVLPSGDYMFTANSKSLCQNGASGGIGYVRFEGCTTTVQAPVTETPPADPCAGYVRPAHPNPFDECAGPTKIKKVPTRQE